LVASLAAIVILGVLLIWVLTRDRAPAPQTAVTKSDAPADTTQQDIANRLEQASRALQAGDEIAAQRHADAVLSISPGHAEARRLRDRAVQATETVTRNLATARGLFAAGRYDEASRAAGEVLAVDPDNAEARRLMDEGAARSRGKGAEEARARTVRARNAAAAAGASKLAAAAYTAAAAAEADASSLYKRGRLAEAMAKFWEASGLFRSAEIAAQTEAAARTERTRIAQAERKPAEPARETAPPPAAPLAPSTTLPPPSLTPPVPPAVPAPASPPQQAPPPPETAAQPASPTSGINEVLDRYEAALESRSLESLKRLWPSLGGAQQAAIRDEFQNTTRIEVEIGSPQINVTGTTATVSFLRTYQLYTVDGQRPRSQSRATMNLRRSGTTWVIDQIRFELLK
jgi:tetratricopeptide (TPR) repeat protein